MQKKSTFHPIYILATLYMLSKYLTPALIMLLKPYDNNDETFDYGFLLLVPIILDIVNLVVVIVNRNKLDRDVFLHCTLIIKYGLIPFYIIGGAVIALCGLLTFTPVVIMIFVGPMMVITLSVTGWIAMIGAMPFSITYIVKSAKEGANGKFISIAAAIAQVFFTFDVISIMILAIKERKCIKATIIYMILAVVAIFSFILFVIISSI